MEDGEGMHGRRAMSWIPAMARCMMKKFIRDLRFFVRMRVWIRTELLPTTIVANKTQRKVSCSSYGSDGVSGNQKG